jgi:DNA-binding response OmpR family regulator
METILLVEDAYELAQALIQELETHNYRVLHVSDGISALQVHATERPSLVILDWMIPRLNGLEVLRRLRQIAPTPIFMLTARGEEVDRVLGLEMGADDYLTKPFSMREFLARVKALLRRAELVQQILHTDQTATEQHLIYGHLRLDPQAHVATLHAVPLDLSPTEFALLHVLLRNPGRAFHRSYLLDLVWGETYDGGERTIDTTVKRLRKKLGPLGEALETVWGIGYRFHAER